MFQNNPNQDTCLSLVNINPIANISKRRVFALIFNQDTDIKAFAEMKGFNESSLRSAIQRYSGESKQKPRGKKTLEILQTIAALKDK